MNGFYIGLHHPSTAWPFLRSMITVMALRDRQSNFRVNRWIMDSGAFTQISKHGKFLLSPDDYLQQIERWRSCGSLEAASIQDWMCEPFILQKTGKTIEEHQALTCESYVYLSERTNVYILPVLQGYEPRDYVRHVREYAFLLVVGAWVGVGSVCKRNGNPDAVEDVLLAIKSERSDLRLHGFGLKKTAFERESIRSMLFSADSMAWSYAGRRQDLDGNDPRRALAYAAEVGGLIGTETMLQPQLSTWWL